METDTKYPDDSLSCCILPYKCNLFPETTYLDIMWHLSMVAVACTLIYVVSTVICLVCRYIEFQRALWKLLHSKKDVDSELPRVDTKEEKNCKNIAVRNDETQVQTQIETSYTDHDSINNDNNNNDTKKDDYDNSINCGFSKSVISSVTINNKNVTNEVDTAEFKCHDIEIISELEMGQISLEHKNPKQLMDPCYRKSRDRINQDGSSQSFSSLPTPPPSSREYPRTPPTNVTRAANDPQPRLPLCLRTRTAVTGAREKSDTDECSDNNDDDGSHVDSADDERECCNTDLQPESDAGGGGGGLHQRHYINRHDFEVLPLINNRPMPTIPADQFLAAVKTKVVDAGNADRHAGDLCRVRKKPWKKAEAVTATTTTTTTCKGRRRN